MTRSKNPHPSRRGEVRLDKKKINIVDLILNSMRDLSNHD